MAEANLALSLISLAGAFVLVFLNGFFVAAEFAIVKVRRTRLEELAGKGIQEARISILCVDKLDEMLSATQLGITIVSIGLGWIGEIAFEDLILIMLPADLLSESVRQGIAISLALFLITMLHVVLGELVPKSMAIQKAEKVTLAVAKPLTFFYHLASPLILLFTSVANFVLKKIGFYGASEPPLSEEELKIVMKESKDDGVISESEAQIINRAFEFSDKKVTDIMVPRERIEFISLARPLEENLATIRRHMHTRFPVVTEGIDSLLGVASVKDIWPRLLANFSNAAFKETLSQPIFVSPHVSQDHLMRQFQAKRVHLAIVKDPQTKRVLGIVTLEDVLETLVGDIKDEYGN